MGERIPLTIADYDAEAGTVTIIFQEVGKTTLQLGMLNEGDYILDFVGPLECLRISTAASKSRGHRRRSGHSHRISSGRNCLHGRRSHQHHWLPHQDLIILEKEVGAVSDKLIVMTDDGSNGNKGFVTDALKQKSAARNSTSSLPSGRWL